MIMYNYSSYGKNDNTTNLYFTFISIRDINKVVHYMVPAKL